MHASGPTKIGSTIESKSGRRLAQILVDNWLKIGKTNGPKSVPHYGRAAFTNGVPIRFCRWPHFGPPSGPGSGHGFWPYKMVKNEYHIPVTGTCPHSGHRYVPTFRSRVYTTCPYNAIMVWGIIIWAGGCWLPLRCCKSVYQFVYQFKKRAHLCVKNCRKGEN